MTKRFAGLLLLSLSGPVAAQPAPAAPAAASSAPVKKPITLERAAEVAGAAFRDRFDPVWRDASHFTSTAKGEGEPAPSLHETDAATGKRTRLRDPVALPGSEKGKEKWLRFGGGRYSPSGASLLVSQDSDLWLLDLKSKEVRRLTKDEDDEENPTFSPDGARVAYTKRNDLYCVEVASGKETRLTTTGTENVLNGKLDWVYEEELANRKSGRSYEWSPDGKAIAYLRLDQTRVPEYPIVDYLPTNGKLRSQKYPKAGDPNPIPSVHVVEVEAPGAGVSITSTPDDFYVAPEMSWTADSTSVAFLKMNRAQDRVELTLLSRNGQSSKVLLVESDPAWINSLEPPRFLKDGSFLWISERTGFFHLYRYAANGTLKNAVTSGKWMVDPGEPWEVDEASGTVLFAATEKDPRERHLYRVKLDGTGFKRLSVEPGTHSLKVAPGGAAYLDTYSSLTAPPKTALVKADGTRVALVDERKNLLEGSIVAPVEMSAFTGSDGTLFYYRLVKPPDFDPARKYPVIVHVYGGPHAQMVVDKWGASSVLDQVLATKGFLVFAMDNRGSWGRGHAFETPLLKRMGEIELKDQLEGVAHLRKMPFVDGARIGIHGWSYGGFMSATAATKGEGVFKAVFVGAPVTDWKYYDSIYTERYMKLPKDNEAGYKASSVIGAAEKLSGKVLLMHGTSDDNVHMQQSMAFIDALMRAKKEFTFVPLPRQLHGPQDPAARFYSNLRLVEFFEKNL